MNFELKNDLLNLPKLQLQLDTVVFDYIDSKPNWSKASEQLNTLLQIVLTNFEASIERNEGVLPKASTYWTLYMDVAAKLLYFSGLAQFHVGEAADEATKTKIVEQLQVSVRCLPNATLEENEEFIAEVKKSIEHITGETIEITLSEKTEACLTAFYHYLKNQ